MKHQVSIRNRKLGQHENVWNANDLDKIAIMREVRFNLACDLKTAKKLVEQLENYASFEITCGMAGAASFEKLGLKVYTPRLAYIHKVEELALEALEAGDVALARDLLTVALEHKNA